MLGYLEGLIRYILNIRVHLRVLIRFMSGL